MNFYPGKFLQSSYLYPLHHNVGSNNNICMFIQKLNAIRYKLKMETYAYKHKIYSSDDSCLNMFLQVELFSSLILCST